jgi:hypothetical protein
MCHAAVRLVEGVIGMSTTESPTAAFVLSLIAGLLIVLGGAVRSMIGFYWFGGMMHGFGGRWGGMMGYPGFGMMGGLGFMSGIVGLVFGVLIMVSAIMLNSRPEGHTTWGTLIVIFSVLSVFGGMGGFGIGLVLGLIGGVLAIAWKPTQTQPKS